MYHTSMHSVNINEHHSIHNEFMDKRTKFDK